jgi:hypothetical protein
MTKSDMKKYKKFKSKEELEAISWFLLAARKALFVKSKRS